MTRPAADPSTPTAKPDPTSSPASQAPQPERVPAAQQSVNGSQAADSSLPATGSSTRQTHAAAAADPATPFRSILFGSGNAPTGLDDIPAPECFPDLNLDQVVASIVAAKEPYRLLGYFHTPLDSLGAVTYRQQVFQDLEHHPTYDLIARFADGMRTMRARIERVNKSNYHYQKQRWFLDAARAYCDTIETLTNELDAASFGSRGVAEVADYLSRYRASSVFAVLRDDADSVARGLDSIVYDVWVRGAKVTVGAFDEEPDYSADVTKTFERFQQRDIEVRPPDRNGRRSGSPASSAPRIGDEFMDHVEAQILDQVAKVFPDRFAALDTFCHAHGDFLDRTIAVFDREIQFYIAYLDYITPLRRAGLTLDYPQMSVDDKAENAADTFDLALATQLLRDAENSENPVVCNDIHLEGSERILVISGPNNGGKTTMARTVGQLHYLAKLGCPVPGRDVRLYLVDEIYSHFEKEEDIATLAGKLQEELNRMRADFERATPSSLMIMNEMFSSTTVRDALFLSKEMLGRVSDLDALGVCVTFLDELATLNDQTVSMVSTVDPNDLARRTFKVIRTPADGKAYAQALAEKYGLTYETLKGRVSS
jgi:DNA mismatch repair protein MutS